MGTLLYIFGRLIFMGGGNLGLLSTTLWYKLNFQNKNKSMGGRNNKQLNRRLVIKIE